MGISYAIYRFLDTIATIVRNNNDYLTRFRYLFEFVKFKLRSPKKFAYFLDNKIYFSNYISFMASIEEIFFFKSYSFNSKSNAPFIIDCGANIGITTIYFKTFFPNSEIINIEAVPNVFKLLEINTKKFTNTTNINGVVTKDKKDNYLEVPTNNFENDLNFSLFKNLRPKHTKFKKVKVNSIKLSKVITRKVDCLILDIEGNEDQVLLDLQEKNKLKLIENIFVEFHNYKNGSLSTITSILSNNGFKIIVGSGVRPPYSYYIDKFYSLPMYAYKV